MLSRGREVARDMMGTMQTAQVTTRRRRSTNRDDDGGKIEPAPTLAHTTSGRIVISRSSGVGVKRLAKQQRSRALVAIQLIHRTHEKICACKLHFGAALLAPNTSTHVRQRSFESQESDKISRDEVMCEINHYLSRDNKDTQSLMFSTSSNRP